WQSDANYESLSEFLLGNVDWLIPAFGSHNLRSIAHAMAAAESLRVPRRRFEFQMLYGMADAIKDAIQSFGYRLRIYTPYGQLLPGMAYLVRRLLENSSNDSFLRQGFAEHLSEEVLLMNPIEHGRAGSVSDRSQREPVAHAPGSPFRNEPPTDFSRESSRAAMHDALSFVRTQLGRDYPAFLNGRTLPFANSFDSVNPSNTLEILGKVAASSVADANAAVAAALAAFPAWRDSPVEARADLLRRTAAEFRRRRFELAAWIVLETGKPWREADADVAEAIDFCEYYAIEGEKLQGEAIARNVPGEDNQYFYEPRGVAVIIAPWNFPLAILTAMTA